MKITLPSDETLIMDDGIRFDDAVIYYKKPTFFVVAVSAWRFFFDVRNYIGYVRI